MKKFKLFESESNDKISIVRDMIIDLEDKYDSKLYIVEIQKGRVGFETKDKFHSSDGVGIYIKDFNFKSTNSTMWMSSYVRPINDKSLIILECIVRMKNRGYDVRVSDNFNTIVVLF